MVGLKLDLRLVRNLGPVALATALGQLLFTIVFGFLICLGLGLSAIESFYVAVALTFSSTIIIVKLLSDKREIDSLHGRIAMGFLIVQDIAVVIAMMLMGSQGAAVAAGGAVGVALLLKMIGVIAVIGLLMRFALPRLLNLLARSQELLLLFAIAWGTALAATGDMLGFSREVGAFLAGLTVAQISEFSIVFVAMGIKLGDVGTGALGLVTMVGLVTITLSTYMILYSQQLYRRLAPWLGVFERARPYRELAVEAAPVSAPADVIVFGLGRYGRRTGSAAAWAERRAAMLAAAGTANLDLVHVVERGLLEALRRMVVPGSQDTLDNMLPQLAAALNGNAEELASGYGIEVTTHLATGTAVRETVERALTCSANLLVVGAHGGHFVRELMLGHAFEVPFERKLRFAGVSESAFQHYLDIAEQDACSDMDGFVPTAALARAPARRLIEHGYAPAIIGRIAAQIDADLIVMGAQGRSDLSYMLLGSVTLHIMQDAVCDVAAFRQRDGHAKS